MRWMPSLPTYSSALPMPPTGLRQISKKQIKSSYQLDVSSELLLLIFLVDFSFSIFREQRKGVYGTSTNPLINPFNKISMLQAFQNAFKTTAYASSIYRRDAGLGVEIESLKIIGLRSIQIWAWKPSYQAASLSSNKLVDCQLFSI